MPCCWRRATHHFIVTPISTHLRLEAARRAVELLMAQLEPYPVLVLDRYWNTLRMNTGAKRPLAAMLATSIHTVAYLAVTGLIAWVVYRKLGLALLRKVWLNFDLVWAAALVATGLVTLLR
jgi:hypothetical protein